MILKKVGIKYENEKCSSRIIIKNINKQGNKLLFNILYL